MEGQTLSHYRVLEKLGGGGMGVVYKALDTKLNRHVALKFLPPELTRDDDARERFMLEAQAASALDHPNICTIYEIDTTPEDQMFIAMGYYEGETLKQGIAQGPLPIEEALDIAIQIAQGLSEAHAADIIHRDIKPANVMLTKNGLMKIVDFGIAKLLGVTGPTETGSTVGTVGYMSPEQLAGKGTDQRTDVWSLGAVLYEMLTGRRPFTGDNEWAVIGAISGQEPVRPRSLRSEIPVGVETVVLKALEKQRTSRYQSADTNVCRTELTPVGSSEAASPWASLFTPRFVVPAVLVVMVFTAVGVFRSGGNADVAWAREEAIPEVLQLVEMDDYASAFQLAEEAERYVPDDPILSGLWPQLSRVRSIDTVPTGADIYFKHYEHPDDDWTHLGKTPLQNVRLPLGLLRVRIEKSGFEELDYVAETDWEDDFLWSSLLLTETGSAPLGTARVPAQELWVEINGLTSHEKVQLPSYRIDQYEVTNGQFLEFVASGGYEQERNWRHAFVSEGRVMSWQEAMSRFRDSTGRQGPSTWEGGSYPAGQEDFPVRGISSYEAAAYAEFSGKSLPTAYHWVGAATPFLATPMIALSNFGGEGPAGVGTHLARVYRPRWKTRAEVA